tara:strand:- start:877 stop:1110 length:234 start_codon:yes stop_codon:yes gene_type:complete
MYLNYLKIRSSLFNINPQIRKFILVFVNSKSILLALFFESCLREGQDVGITNYENIWMLPISLFCGISIYFFRFFQK